MSFPQPLKCTPMETSIRLAGLKDIPAINALAREVFPETYKDILSPEQITYMLDWMYSPGSLRRQIEQEGQVYLLAFQKPAAGLTAGGKGGAAAGGQDAEAVVGNPLNAGSSPPVGYASFQQEGDDIFHLQKLYVHPSVQGRGLGEMLLRAVEAKIKARHPAPCRMQLNVNRMNRAKGFYEKMGLRVIRSGDFPIGGGFFMNDYIMEAEL